MSRKYCWAQQGQAYSNPAADPPWTTHKSTKVHLPIKENFKTTKWMEFFVNIFSVQLFCFKVISYWTLGINWDFKILWVVKNNKERCTFSTQNTMKLSTKTIICYHNYLVPWLSEGFLSLTGCVNDKLIS